MPSSISGQTVKWVTAELLVVVVVVVVCVISRQDNPEPYDSSQRYHHDRPSFLIEIDED